MFSQYCSRKEDPHERTPTTRQSQSIEETGVLDSYKYDQGLTAWFQVVVSYLLVFNGFGYLSAFGLFQSHWESVLSRPASDVAWVGSLQLCLLFFIGTVSGRAMDAGYFRSLLLVGCFLQILGIFTTSVATRFWQLVLSQGVVQGIGNGLLFTPLITLVSTYFKRKRAFALALAACGAPIGGVIFTTVSLRPIDMEVRTKIIQIARQLEQLISFGWIIRVMGFVVLLNAFIVAAFARPRPIKRASGPLIEWQAFHEVPYTLYAVGVFFVLWGLYIAYFYVSS